AAVAGDDDTLVRAFALVGGARIDASGFREVARRVTDEDDAILRAAALRVLERAGEAGAGESLRAFAMSADAGLRLAAAEPIAESSLPDAVDLLARLCDDQDAGVRRAALGALAPRDPQRALVLSVARLHDRTDDALRALEELPMARTSPAVRAFADESRGRALRYASLSAAVPADGEIATLL